MDSVQNDLIFIDKIIGCKIAISDLRSSFPSVNELLKLTSQVMVGGFIGGKGGILHVHLGNLDTGMDILFELIEKYQIPAKSISPTHVGRSKKLFEQSLKFAKLGGIIDITTGASKFDEPYKQVLLALESGVDINNICFSSDGNAGLSKKDETGKEVLYSAPFDQNLYQVKLLVHQGGVKIDDAFKLITTNPARNLSLHHKGKINIHCDADFCLFDENLELIDVMSKGKFLMKDKVILVNNEV
jgi:beta-aspartyl-dipeptidase (metallo-type)